LAKKSQNKKDFALEKKTGLRTGQKEEAEEGKRSTREKSSIVAARRGGGKKGETANLNQRLRQEGTKKGSHAVPRSDKHLLPKWSDFRSTSHQKESNHGKAKR